MTYPHLFRVLVVKEQLGEAWEGVSVYVAIALECYQTAQAKTLEQLRSSIEYVLVAQRYLDQEHGTRLMCAPEEFQRVRNRGEFIICPDPKMEAFMGGPRRIIDRWDVDIDKSEWKIVERT